MDKSLIIEIKKDPAGLRRKDETFVVHQFGGGGVIETTDPREAKKLEKQYYASIANCGKPVLGGGFNPRYPGEREEIDREI